MKRRIMNRIKKTLVIGLIVSLSMTGLTACGGGNSGTEVGGSVVTAGSTSVQPLSEELAAVFMDANPGYTVDVQGGGSGQGIKSIQEGIADIGALSRNLKDEEKSSVSKEITIALDGIAVVVNKDTTVTNLTLEQIRQIYTGEITNWKEVGGKDTPITVVSREEGSGTRGAFVEITKVAVKDNAGNETDMTVANALIQPSTGSVKTTVASTPNTIGYVSLGALDDSVKAVTVEGVVPSIENIIDGNYKISRPFIYVVGDEVSEAAQMYLDFVLSEEGQAVVVDNGFISVK
ncbi:MAG TPA: phosphate ABC transporter substrate-binding protein [Anaerovoracaceae bacterium]|nr:phosphate ABC transporter substrate-binding protein [Anaerovoracaceae bacterium]